jgi:arylsulfatase A-like enzyme
VTIRSESNTGQFGKNHLGDPNKYLPTAHGFDEFFGNLYHLNAEEEPEMPHYPLVKAHHGVPPACRREATIRPGGRRPPVRQPDGQV